MLMRKLLGAVFTIALLVPATSALGDPNLADVHPHRHFIATPSRDLVQIGPRVCDDPSLQDAFNQFHYNVHQGNPNAPTPGPVGGAPGLDNHRGADIIARPCSFTP